MWINLYHSLICNKKDFFMRCTSKHFFNFDFLHWAFNAFFTICKPNNEVNNYNMNFLKKLSIEGYNELSKDINV